MFYKVTVFALILALLTLALLIQLLLSNQSKTTFWIHIQKRIGPARQCLAGFFYAHSSHSFDNARQCLLAERLTSHAMRPASSLR